jgi:hypothetical protein
LPAPSTTAVLITPRPAHAAALDTQLASLGVAPDQATLPDHVTLIHLGGLTGPGLDNQYCVERLAALSAANPTRFYALWSPQDRHPSDLPTSVAAQLDSWWDANTFPVALALDTPSGFVLASHEGLSRPAWLALGSGDYQDTAEQLNTQRQLDTLPDPADQLLLPWLIHADTRALPFIQVYATADRLVDWHPPTLHTKHPRLLRTALLDAPTARFYTIADLGAKLIGLGASSTPLAYPNARVGSAIQPPAQPRRRSYPIMQ